MTFLPFAIEQALIVFEYLPDQVFSVPDYYSVEPQSAVVRVVE